MGRDGFTGLVILAASLGLLAGTIGLERHPMVPVGPGFYPRIILSITALMALALVVSDIVARRRSTVPAAPRAASRYGLVAAAFAVFAAYVLALPFLGFRIATFVFVAAMQALLEPPRTPRRWAVLIVVALATAAVTYFAFERYLQVLLPRGRWTDF
jgi:hypothetical protein